MQPNDNPKNSTAGATTWQAPEYIRRHHPTGWYMLLMLATVAVSGIIYLLAKDIFGSAIIALLGVIVGIAASHQPKLIAYELTGSTLSLESKPYNLKLYKSFSVVDEGELVSATLMPIKRFMLPLAIYFTHEDADRIVGDLSSRLPHDDHPADAVERLAARLRF